MSRFALEFSQISPQQWWGWGLVSLVIGVISLLLFHPRCQNLGLLRLQGLVLVKQRQADYLTEFVPNEAEQDFEQRYQQLIGVYHRLSFQLNLSSDSLRLEIATPHALPVLKADALKQFCADLQRVLDTLPSEKYFIKVQIDAQMDYLLKKQQIHLRNHEGKLGLNRTEFPRFSLKGIFFNG